MKRLLVKSLRVNLVCGGEKSLCEMSLGESTCMVQQSLGEKCMGEKYTWVKDYGRKVCG